MSCYGERETSETLERRPIEGLRTRRKTGPEESSQPPRNTPLSCQTLASHVIQVRSPLILSPLLQAGGRERVEAWGCGVKKKSQGAGEAIIKLFWRRYGPNALLMK